MKKLIVALIAGALMSTTSGCMTVTEGQQTFAITAQKYVIGKSFADAEAKIPEGAEVLTVVHVRGPLFGLIQQTYISGTK